MCTVLIIEDNDDNLVLFMDVIATLGCTVHGVKQVEKALDQLHSLIPTIVILDMALQGEMDGLDIARKIREEDIFNNTLVIGVTADTARYSEHKVMEAGCDAYYPKPFRVTELRDFIRQFLENP